MLLTKSLETPRLTIRSWRKSDKDFTLSLWGDKENGKYMSDPVRENMDEAYLQCVDEMEDDPEGYYLVALTANAGTARHGITAAAVPQAFEDGGTNERF